MILVRNLLQKLRIFNPPTRFRPGDQVQPIGGGAFMIVESIKKNKESKTVQLACKYFDSETKQTRINLFNEEEVKSFDWYHPNG